MDNRLTKEILEDKEEDNFYVWVIKGAIKLFFLFCLCILFFIGVIAYACYMCSD